MNCPVCKIKIEFNLPEEDTYYDCSHCQSSLLFSKGECQIINAEQIVSKDLEQTQSGEHVTDIKISHIDQNQEEIFGQITNEHLSKEQANPSVMEENLPEESVKLKINTETASQKIEKQEADSEIQNETEEENFFPDKETKVPELPENELEAPAAKNLKSENFSHSLEEESKKTNSANDQKEERSASADQKEKEDFSDVAEFANNPEKNTKGLYLYDLTLSQINSQDLKDEVLSVLEDSFLNLSAEDSSLNLEAIEKKGEIKIPKISPIQTYIIVHSLMGLPLNIHWEQHHIADE